MFGSTFAIVSFLVGITIVVFVHEFGHFWVARRNGVRCHAFSIGFGPELFGYTDKLGTRWKFSLIPLGGYVKMFGEAETMQAVEGGATDGAKPEPRALTEEEKKVSFKYKTVGQRSAIAFAGPAANFLFTIVVFWITFMIYGQSITEPVIGQVQANSAAAAAGLMPDDRVLTVDHTAIERFEDIRSVIQLSTGAAMDVTIRRGGQEMTLSVTPRQTVTKDVFGNEAKAFLLGITSNGETHFKALNPAAALGASVQQTYDIVRTNLVAVGQMLTGRRGTEDLGGPIRIAKYTSQAAKAGAAEFVLMLAVISLSLGFMNLLPVPVLDGGHLLFYAIEAARRRPLSERAQEWGLRVGLALVLALMLFVTWNDIFRSS
ncbi:MAG: RIP metalloprotease RseP [Rhodospirillaceae bacterium]|nr:RIP metalloprotease RseP [Rhodospirillaceae bacterium]